MRHWEGSMRLVARVLFGHGVAAMAAVYTQSLPSDQTVLVAVFGILLIAIGAQGWSDGDD